MWLLQCCLLVKAVAIRAAYYHEQSMATFEPPDILPKDSFFGYSIAFHENSLVTSAPRADKDGQLFSCDLPTRNCTRMTVPITTATSRVYNGHHYNHNFWLGATIKSDVKYLFVCAPRTTSEIQIVTPAGQDKYKYFGTNGHCYFKHSSKSQFVDMMQMSNTDRVIKITHSENATDSFGWSMDVDLKGAVRVGSPSIAAGRVITYSDPGEAETVLPKFLGAPNLKGFNFGYSIATGVFISSAMPGIAVGTPYGDIGVGKVYIYDNDQKLQWIIDDPSGGVGSMFAAALCSAQVDGTTTSLLVGAPAHFTGNSEYHTGAVYLYRYDGKTKHTMAKYNSIFGNSNGAFFGYAIANVGDMDQDGKDEIVIAAPYEDEGKGVVYLYPGSTLGDGRIPTWLQRFKPEAASYQNLGLSLVANKYSDGACSDLAIGSPGSDSVLVYHCLTVITVEIQTKVPDMQNRKDKTSFAFDLCINAKYPTKPKKITAKFTVRVKIAHQNAILTNAKASNDFVDYDYSLDSILNPNDCKKIDVTTVENGDYEQEIQFNIAAKLLNDPKYSTEFDSSKATVSSNSNLMSHLSVRAAECKQEKCKPNLSVKVTTNVKNPYLIGSSKTERVSVSVSNGDADTAYRPCVRLSVSGDATVLSAPTDCKYDGERQRICQRQSPLKPNSTWELATQSIELNMTGLRSMSDDIVVKAEVFNRCEKNNKPDDSHLVIIKLTTNIDGLKIESKTDQGDIVALHKEDFKNGKILHHTYTISNIGEINWDDIYCHLWLFRNNYITYNDSIQIYKGEKEQPPCLIKKDPNSTSPFHGLSCGLGSLDRKQSITLVIPITLIPGTLENVLEKSNATVTTTLRVVAQTRENHEKDKSILTTLVLQKGTVPIWIIIVGVLVGILIVLLIAFALYECGLLRRKKKEELVELKREVKRKSMMLQRQSVRLSDSARAELRNRTYRELLDAAEIKEAEEAEEARKSQLTSNTGETKCQDKVDGGNGCTSRTSTNEPSGSHFDIRAHIEKTLRENPKGYRKFTENTSLI